jgi:PAS domain-containing protein
MTIGVDMSIQDDLMQFLEGARFAINNLPGILYVKDLNSKYMECSSDFEKILKVKKENLINRPDDDFPWKNYAEES